MLETIITAIVIDQLRKVVWSDAVEVAHVYCNYEAKADRNAPGLLAAILRRLVQARQSIAEPRHLYQQHVNRATNPSLEDVFEALQLVLAHYSRAYMWLMLWTCVKTKMALATNFRLRSVGCKQNKSVLDGYFALLSHHSGRVNGALTLELRVNDGDVK